MSRNRLIDALRAIACAFVLFVHCPFPGAFGVCVSALARFAVPFFLMVSGYYCWRDTDAAMFAAAKKQLHSTGRLTLIGTAFYAVSNTLRDTITGTQPFSWLGGLLSATGIRRFFIFNRAVFLSSVMYYLFMLLYVYALYMLLLRAKAMRLAYAAIPVLLTAGVVLNMVVLAPWYYTGNWLLTGLPFFVLGHLIAARKIRIAHPEWFILPGAVLCCLEALRNSEVYCGLGAIMLSVSLLLTCIKYPQAKMPDFLVRFGRRSSVVLFVIHCGVRDYVKLLLPASTPLYGILLPVTILALSAALSAVIPRLAHISKSH